jgi:hypothetical protein
VLSKWTSPARYDIRVDDLHSTLLMPRVSVFDDGAADVLRGQQGRDWFIGDFRKSSRGRDRANTGGRTGERFAQLP